jgi:hypothetical protein
MDSGKWIRELRGERSVKPGDIERTSRAIANVKRSTDFYISHSTLCDIEAGSVPSVQKLFSLARCLKISLEELLLAFGIDVNELRRGNNNSEPGLGTGSELESHEPDFGLRPNFEAGFENQETCLLRLSPTQMVGIFPPQLHRYIDPKRYRYAVIGTEDDTMGDLIPPRSLVEIDVMQNAVHMAGWTSVLTRPIYLVGYGDKHSCCWCQVQGNELALLPHPLSQKRVRYFKLPKEASIVGRVTNCWRLS